MWVWSGSVIVSRRKVDTILEQMVSIIVGLVSSSAWKDTSREFPYSRKATDLYLKDRAQYHMSTMSGRVRDRRIGRERIKVSPMVDSVGVDISFSCETTPLPWSWSILRSCAILSESRLSRKHLS